MNNNYHYKYIEKIRAKVLAKLNSQSKSETNETITKIYWTLPYINKLEKQTNKVVNNINEIMRPDVHLTVAYKTRKTISFFRNKDCTPADVEANVVYKYTCDQCPGHTYVGETVRHLETRKREHRRGEPQPSEISLHHHDFKETNFSIALKTVHTTIGEAIVYNSIPSSLRLNNIKPPFQLQLFDTYTS